MAKEGDASRIALYHCQGLSQLVERLHRTRGDVLGRHDLARSRLCELIQVIILNALVLHDDGARLLPLAVRAELDVADDGGELGVMDVVSDFRMVDFADYSTEDLIQ